MIGANRCHSLAYPIGRTFLSLAYGAAALLTLSTVAMSQAAPPQPNCAKDAMIVFDASGSMTGMGFGERTVRRIEQSSAPWPQCFRTLHPCATSA